MKIAVIGAGAIGGMLAVRLALSGHAVTVVEQGAHLEAIRRTGLKLVHHDGAEEVARDLRAVASCEDAGRQDLVLLALKAYTIAALAPQMRALFADDTIVVTLQNGLPWWYFQNFNGPHAGYRLKSADPDGVIEGNIEPRRIIGCVVYPAGEIVAPGVVKRLEGDRFPVGELDGTQSERVARVSEALVGAHWKAPVLTDIRSEIWLKLWGNMSFNPISALTHATLVDICQRACDTPAGRRHDARGASDRREAWRDIPRSARKAYRRCRKSRCAQDLDIAGCRSRARGRG